MSQFHAIQIGCVQFMIFIMFVQGFWYGSTLVNKGELAAGDVLTAFWASFQATKAIDQIMPHIIVLEKGRAAGSALKKIVEDTNYRPLTKIPTTISPAFCEGGILMKNVCHWFSYAILPVLPKN